MGIQKLTYKTVSDGQGGIDYCLPNSSFKSFNASILDLGDVTTDGEYFEALAAIFDLEGFTSFCSQVDPHLVIPEYLTRFFDWIFSEISDEFKMKQNRATTTLWCQLPFYAKFMGDGVMFLWDTRNVDHAGLGNVVVSLLNICRKYSDSFLPQVRRSVSKPPLKLRCGIARGQIISIGDGKDFVGPCINIASRLQKIGQFSFAFSKRGFSLQTRYFSDDYLDDFMLIKFPIRGVGEEELIFVLKDEFNLLSDDEKKQLYP